MYLLAPGPWNRESTLKAYGCPTPTRQFRARILPELPVKVGHRPQQRNQLRCFPHFKGRRHLSKGPRQAQCLCRRTPSIRCIPSILRATSSHRTNTRTSLRGLEASIHLSYRRAIQPRPPSSNAAVEPLPPTGSVQVFTPESFEAASSSIPRHEIFSGTLRHRSQALWAMRLVGRLSSNGRDG